MNKLATKILVCLQYFKVLANSIGRLKDKRTNAEFLEQKLCGEGKASPSSQHIQIFPVARGWSAWRNSCCHDNAYSYKILVFRCFLRVKTTTCYNLKNSPKVICKQFITSIVFTCILHGSMSVVDNLRKHITRNYVFGFPVFSSVYFNTCYYNAKRAL